MAVHIRLKRTGRKNRASWRISVFDSRTRRDGPSIEDIGWYDNVTNPKLTKTSVDVERARHWLKRGARPSVTVHQIFKRSNVYAAPGAGS